jgi:hypothetical protein
LLFFVAAAGQHAPDAAPGIALIFAGGSIERTVAALLLLGLVVTFRSAAAA